MSAPRDNRHTDRRGFSVIEVVVAMTIFSIVVLGLSATGAMAARDLQAGQKSASASSVVQGTVDSLISLGWAALSPQSGVDTAQGVVVNWQVTGDNPRRLVAVTERLVMSTTHVDTIVTYVSK